MWSDSFRHPAETRRIAHNLGIFFIPMHQFEFDPNKSGANRIKHGIDFVEAQALWDDPDPLELTARSTEEPRIVTIQDSTRSVTENRCRLG